MPVTSTVLMSVYHRVKLDELDLCLESMDWQSRHPDQIVIVLDGEVLKPIDARLQLFQKQSVCPVTLIRLPENVGLSSALNEGLKHCDGDWILRMDADDISLPERFAQQLSYAEQTDIDLVGSALYEFSEHPSRPEKLKPVHSSHEQMVRSLALRNPVNHPTACVRKQKLIDAGGYPNLPLLEDYFLWSKLLKSGARFHNLEQPLYLFRFDEQTLKRRGGLENFNNETWLRRWMYKEKLISLPAFLVAVTLQLFLRLTPASLRRSLWRRSRESVDIDLDLPMDKPSEQA